MEQSEREEALRELRKIADDEFNNLKLAMADGDMSVEEQAETLDGLQRSVDNAQRIGNRIVGGSTEKPA